MRAYLDGNLARSFTGELLRRNTTHIFRVAPKINSRTSSHEPWFVHYMEMISVNALDHFVGIGFRVYIPVAFRMDSASPFECNVCFEEAKEPVVTRCGHLYCWHCLSEWLERGALDCPVCKASVTRETVIPLYGRGESSREHPSSRPRPSNHERSTRSQPSGMSLSVGSIGLAPFVGFEFSSPPPQRLRLTHEESQQRMVSHFFIFIGIVIILMILSS